MQTFYISVAQMYHVQRDYTMRFSGARESTVRGVGDN